MRANLSILGLHNYTNGAVWDELILPEGIDREVLIGNILLECAELEVIYPDPDIMTSAIGLWSAAELDSWRKLHATTTLDYNPIWNKDGTVTESEVNHRLHKELGSDDEEFRSEGSSSRGQYDTGDVTTKVSAYDAGTFQDREKNSTTANSTEHVIADNVNKTERDVDRDNMDSDDRYYERRETGNIGVTTTQQMIKEEREVDQFHIDDYIVQSFKKRFCLLVY